MSDSTPTSNDPWANIPADKRCLKAHFADRRWAKSSKGTWTHEAKHDRCGGTGKIVRSSTQHYVPTVRTSPIGVTGGGGFGIIRPIGNLDQASINIEVECGCRAGWVNCEDCLGTGWK